LQTLDSLLVMSGMTSVGYALLTAARFRSVLSPVGDVAIAFLVGAGVTTLVGFWVSLFVSAAGLMASFTIMAAGLVVSVVYIVKHTIVPRLTLRIPVAPLWIYPLALLLLCDSALLVYAVFRGDPGWDGIFVWGIKARTFASIGGVSESFYADASRLWTHPGYPLLFPLTEALVYRLLGTPSEHVDMLIIAVFAISLLVLLYELIRRSSGPFVAVAITLLLVTLPGSWLNIVHASADLPLAVFSLAGVGLLYRWFDHGHKPANLVLGSVLLAFALWVKRDALVIWVVGAAAILVWTAAAAVKGQRVSWRTPLIYAAPALALVPWLFLVTTHHVVDQDFSTTPLPWLIQHRDRMPVLAGVLVHHLLLVSTWGLAWVLVGASAVLRPPFHSAGRTFLLGAISASLLSLIPIYTLSVWTPYMAHVNSSLVRVVFEALPTGLLFMGTGITTDWGTWFRSIRQRGAGFDTRRIAATASRQD
jgi:hypothetical protein